MLLRIVRRIAFVCVALLLLFLLLLGILVNTDAMTSSLESIITSETGVRCTIKGGSSLRLFPRLGVEARDIVLDQPQGFSASRPLASAEKIYLNFIFPRFVLGELELGRAEVYRPTVSLIRKADGTSNWLSVLALFRQSRSAEVSSQLHPKLPIQLQDASYDGLIFREGILQIDDALHGYVFQAANMDITLRGGEKRLFSFAADVSLGQDMVMQHVSGTGELVLDATEALVQVTADITAQGTVTILDRTLDASLEFRANADLGQDTVAFTLEQAALDRAQATAEVVLSGTMQGEPVMQGTVTVSHLSLPFWFAFGQRVPGSLQHALDDLAGTLTFRLDSKGVEVSDIRATVLGMTLSGQGGVYDFSKPVIYIDAKGDYIDVNAIFPEVAVKPPAVMPRPRVSEPPVLLFTSDEYDVLEVGYDIRIAAKRFRVWGFEGQGLAFRCGPSKRGTYTSYVIDSLYGGRARATLDIREDFGLQLELDSVTMDTPAKLLAGMEAAGGVLSAKGDLVADASTVQGLLADLNGKLSVQIDSGYFAVRTDEDNPGAQKYSGRKKSYFQKLDFDLNMEGRSPAPDKQQGLMPYVWNLKGKKTVSDNEVSTFTLSGPVLIDPDTMLPERLNGMEMSVQSMLGMQLPSGYAMREIHYSGLITADLEKGPVKFEKGRANILGAKVLWDARCDNMYAGADWTGYFASQDIMARKLFDVIWGKGSFQPADPRVLSRAKLRGTFIYRPGELALAIEEGAFDQTVFSGNVTASDDGDVYKFDIKGNTLDLDRYLPAAEFSEKPTPFDASGLRRVTLHGTVGLGHLVYKNMVYSDVRASTSVGGGRIEVQPIRAKLYDGTVSGMFRGTVNENGGLLARLRMSFDHVALGALTTRFTGDSYVQGRAAIAFDVGAEITSFAEIPGALNGEWQFSVREGTYRLSKQESGAGKPASYSFSTATGSGVVDKGVLVNKDFLLSGPLISITGDGAVDMGRERVDYTAIVTVAGIPSFPVKVHGSLYEPQTSVQHIEILPRTITNIGGGLFSLIRGVITLPLTAAEALKNRKPEAAPVE